LCLRWSRDAAVAPFLREWTARHVPMSKRSQKRRAVLSVRGSNIDPRFPYKAVLFALRGHASAETEQFLLLAAKDHDPTFRSTAVGSLGWWEPFAQNEVLLHLNAARFDPSPEVRHAARASLARLGERQALQWFRQALSSDNRQRVLEAIQTIVVENLTLLWPDLDRIADGEDSDLVHCAKEGLEQMQEEFDNGWGR
jgi:HEAT repeat protein